MPKFLLDKGRFITGIDKCKSEFNASSLRKSEPKSAKDKSGKRNSQPADAGKKKQRKSKLKDSKRRTIRSDLVPYSFNRRISIFL